jgi:signal peptidase II
MALVAGVVVSVDQWSKDWAQGYLQGLPDQSRHIIGPLSLQLATNRGAAFSLGNGMYPIVVAVAVALVVAVIAYSRRAARGGVGVPVIIGLGLLSGGALSNLADRSLRHHGGAVVDFIRVVSWWPIFNVADMAITGGAVVLAVTFLRSGAKSREASTSTLGGGTQGTAP